MLGQRHTVLLINSPLFRERNPLYDEDSLPPIGLGYIATTLEQAGILVKLIDAVADRIPLNEIIELIATEKPQVVATNLFTTNYELIKELVESIVYPEIRVVIGGLSTRTLHKKIFGWNYQGKIDVVFGDGELIMPAIVKNIVTQEPEQEISNRRYFKVDSNSIYYVKDISSLSLNRAFFSNEPVKHLLGFIEANIIASRGCIYNCSFCASARSLNKDLTIRERSTTSTIRELKNISKEFPSVTSIRVLDDLFLKGANSIQNAIKVFRQFPFHWRSMAHVLTFQGVDLQTLVDLKKSGCSELFIGIESGSPRILKLIHKTHNIEKIISNLLRILEVGISIKGYFIYGFPRETKEDFESTYRLASILKEASIKYNTSFRTSVFQFRPYHGTEIFRELQANGLDVESVSQMEANTTMSSLVGRLQFNFHSGNYSSESETMLQRYIYLTANLSSAKQWGF